MGDGTGASPGGASLCDGASRTVILGVSLHSWCPSGEVSGLKDVDSTGEGVVCQLSGDDGCFPNSTIFLQELIEVELSDNLTVEDY